MLRLTWARPVYLAYSYQLMIKYLAGCFPSHSSDNICGASNRVLSPIPDWLQFRRDVIRGSALEIKLGWANTATRLDLNLMSPSETVIHRNHEVKKPTVLMYTTTWYFTAFNASRSFEKGGGELV